MSEDFEKEYRQLIDAEIPDLWDRIESRLPEVPQAQAVEKTQQAAGQVQAMEQAAGQAQMTGQTRQAAEQSSSAKQTQKTVIRKRFFNSRNVSLAVMAAAAVMCVVVMGPMMMRRSADVEGDASAVGVPQEDKGSSLGEMAAFIKDKVDGSSYDLAPESPNFAPNADSAGYADGVQSNNHVAESAGSAADNGDSFDEELNHQGVQAEDEPAKAEVPVDVVPSDEEIEAARAVAEKYYQRTVLEVIYMEVKTLKKDQVVFMVHCSKGGEIVDPDRTVEVTYDGERWEVTNEGY